MTWSSIVRKYKFDGVLETDHHPDGSHHGRVEQHELFHCDPGAGGSEFEVTNFLNALVKLFKFRNILETGAEQGHGTVALAEAVCYNGVGHVTTVDNCQVAGWKVPLKLKECGLSKYVTYVPLDSESFAKQYDGEPFDFVFFDCGFPARVNCFHTLMERGKLSRIVSFHDVPRPRVFRSEQDSQYRDDLDEIAEKYAKRWGGLFNIFSRGFRIFQLEL
jgi:predicted O-methyltransferase YrrM